MSRDIERYKDQEKRKEYKRKYMKKWQRQQRRKLREMGLNSRGKPLRTRREVRKLRRANAIRAQMSLTHADRVRFGRKGGNAFAKTIASYEQRLAHTKKGRENALKAMKVRKLARLIFGDNYRELLSEDS